MTSLNLDNLLATVSKKRAEMDARSGKNNVIKPPAGKSRWRILPGWRPAEPATFFHDFAQHWIKNPQDGKVVGVTVCERETYGKPCTCCDRVGDTFKALKQAGFTKDSPQWKTLLDANSKRVTIVNALRRDGEQKSDTPILLALGSNLTSDLMALISTRAEEGVNILDLAAGKDIIIERIGSGMDTEYKLADAGAPSKVNPDVMANLVNIDAYIEAERQKGVSKVALIDQPIAHVLARVGSSSTPTLAPPASAASRVIDVEADEIKATLPTSAASARHSKPLNSENLLSEAAINDILSQLP